MGNMAKLGSFQKTRSRKSLERISICEANALALPRGQTQKSPNKSSTEKTFQPVSTLKYFQFGIFFLGMFGFPEIYPSLCYGHRPVTKVLPLFNDFSS